MRELTPQLVHSLKHYSKESLVKDIVAGVIVAIIALPLSIALALASGVSPEQGLYTAIVAGFLISALGAVRCRLRGQPQRLPPLWRALWPAAVWKAWPWPLSWRGGS